MDATTHIRVTKSGHEEWLARTTWDRITPAADGSRDGYFEVSQTPPEVTEMQQVKELKTKSAVKAEAETEVPVVDPVLVSEAATPVVKEKKAAAKPAAKKPANKK